MVAEGIFQHFGGGRALRLIWLLKRAIHKKQVWKVLKSDADTKEKHIAIFAHFAKYGEDLTGRYKEWKQQQ